MADKEQPPRDTLAPDAGSIPYNFSMSDDETESPIKPSTFHHKRNSSCNDESKAQAKYLKIVNGVCCNECGNVIPSTLIQTESKDEGLPINDFFTSYSR